MTSEKKQQIIKEHATHPGDTGSPQVQIALLSAHIAELTEHLKVHKKDNHSRHGLLLMVSRRGRLIKYLRSCDPGAYRSLMDKLGLRAKD